MSYDRLQYELAKCETLDLTEPDSALAYPLTPDAMLLEHLVVRYTSDATVGNRTVALQITDAADVVLAQHGGDVNQAASLVRSYVFGRAQPSDAAFVGVSLRRPLHLYRLEVGWKIKVVDLANIAVTDTLRLIATVRRIRSSLTV